MDSSEGFFTATSVASSAGLQERPSEVQKKKLNKCEIKVTVEGTLEGLNNYRFQMHENGRG